MKGSEPGSPSLPASVAVAALGLLVLVAWTLGWDRVVQPLDASSGMRPSTAAWFLVAGASAVALRFGWRAPAAAAVLALAVLPALVLFQYATGLETGLDRLVGETRVPGFTAPHPGRMAPNTALALLACATSLGVLCLRAARPPLVFAAALAAAFAASVGMLALLGYAFGFEAGYTWLPWTPMAVHTAVAVLVLAGDLVRATRAVVLRGLPAMVAGGVVAAATIGIWENLAHHLRDSTASVAVLFVGLGLAFALASALFLAAERRRLAEELRRALSEVRSLSALLASCANCRRIRDESDDTWHPLERYLERKGIPTHVTHGICDECMERLYPDVARRLEARRRASPES